MGNLYETGRESTRPFFWKIGRNLPGPSKRRDALPQQNEKIYRQKCPVSVGSF